MVTRFVLSVCFALALVVTCAHGATLTLKNSVYRGALPLTVADLFNVSGAKVTALSQFSLEVLNGGWHETQDFAAQLKAAGFSVQLQGPERVWLGLCQPLALDVLALAVQQQLEAQVDKSKVKVVSVSPLGQKAPCIELSQSLLATEVEWHKPTARLATQHRLNEGKTLTLWWTVDYALHLPVALTALSLRQEINAKAFEYRWLSAKQGGYELPLTAPELVQRRASQSIAAGEAISLSNSEVVPVVEKGEFVTLIVKQGAITIEAKAKALQSGQIAEVIQVLPSQGTGPVNGKISAKGVVYAAF